MQWFKGMAWFKGKAWQFGQLIMQVCQQATHLRRAPQQAALMQEDVVVVPVAVMKAALMQAARPRLLWVVLALYDNAGVQHRYHVEFEEWGVRNVSDLLKLLAKKPWWNELPAHKRKLYRADCRIDRDAVCVVDMVASWRPRICDGTMLVNEPDRFHD